MTTKTPGQVAGDAYHEAVNKGCPLDSKEAWEEAAKAVLDMQRKQLEALVTKWLEESRETCWRSQAFWDCANDLERVLKGGE